MIFLNLPLTATVGEEVELLAGKLRNIFGLDRTKMTVKVGLTAEFFVVDDFPQKGGGGQLFHQAGETPSGVQSGHWR